VSTLGRGELLDALSTESPDERLYVTPLLDTEEQVDRGAIDLRLGTEFLLLRRVRRPGIDPRVLQKADLDEMQERLVVPFGEELWLHPRHFVLAATLEYLELPPNMSASVVGRSSWGRMGLLVATAVFVHPGFRGCLTLELVNEGDAPICLSPGMRIAQLVVDRHDELTELTPNQEKKYLAPVRPQPSRLWTEHKELRQLGELGDGLRSRLG
jgi:dCTP deaminase